MIMKAITPNRMLHIVENNKIRSTKYNYFRIRLWPTCPIAEMPLKGKNLQREIQYSGEDDWDFNLIMYGFVLLFNHFPVTSSSTLRPWFISLFSLGSLSKYTCPFRWYHVLLSTAHHIFMPYFAGLLFKYCLNGQFSLKGTNCSSTVIYVPVVYWVDNCWLNISQISLIISQ